MGAMLLMAIVLACFAFVPSHCLQLNLRSAGAPVPDINRRVQDWRAMFDTLLSLIEDEEFRGALRDHRRDLGDSANYCQFEMIECDELSQIIEMRLQKVRGAIKWEFIPRSVVLLSVKDSELQQAADFTMVPRSVKSLSFENVKFGGDTVGKFNKKHSQLQTFICRNCGLTNMDWASLPSLLVRLDVAQNKMAELSIASMPGTLRVLVASGCHAMVDAAQLRTLPPPMQLLDLSNNQVTGSIDGVLFPPSLETLLLSHNQLTGKLNVEGLPFTLVEMDVSYNQFEGSLGDFTSFMSLRSLDTSGNRFESVAWEKLPPRLISFKVCENQLTGQVLFDKLPLTIKVFDARKNKLDGALNVPSLPASLEFLDVSDNMLSGHPDFTQFKPNIRYVYVQNNQLEGTPDLTWLPLDTKRVLIFGNNWDSLMPQV